jgi:hypothetical protein
VIHRELRRAITQQSDIISDESARRYVDHLSQTDTDGMQEALQENSSEICIVHMDEIQELVVRYVQERINRILARKGQSIQPRVSLSIESVHEHDDEDDDEDEIADSETHSEVRPEREPSSTVKVKVKKKQ